MPENETKQDKQASAAQARQVIDVFHEISTLLVPHLPHHLSLSCFISSKLTFFLRVILERRSGQTNSFNLHIPDRKRCQSRGVGGMFKFLFLFSVLVGGNAEEEFKKRDMERR
jgi:hypothetical protein